MSPTNDLQQRVKQLERLLADTRQGLERQRQTRTQIAKALVAVVAVGSLVAVVQEARAWGGCNQFLSSYGLKTFCAGDPALASDINGNFKTLVDWLEPKLGPLSAGTVSAGGSFVGNGQYLTAIAGANITPGTVAAQALDTMVQQALVPAGTIVAFGGTTAPAGWLVCNGTEYDASGDKAKLYGAIGTSFGGVAGSKFNVPDLRGRFLRGWDNGSGRDPDASSRTVMKLGGNTGDKIGSTQGYQLQAHTHDYLWAPIDSGNITTGAKKIRGADQSTLTSTTGGTETRPLNANVNYIIKY